MMFRTLEVSDPALAPPGLRFVTVKSAALGQRADVLLFVPPQAAALQGVPLVLLLHGVHGSHWAWAFQGGAHLTAQRLIDAGEIPPMVLAMPSDGLWGDGSGYVCHAEQDFERWIVDEVPAVARAASSACTVASPLCIAGLSMGGFGALRLAGRHPQRFVAAAGHSSVTEAGQLDALMVESRSGWAAAPADRSVIASLRGADAPLPALRFDCGRDDPFIAANRQLHAELQAAGIAHDYAEHDGGHGWAYWAQHLEDTLRFFGRTLTNRNPTP
jgi:enterochelin esterase-like enzyme